MGILDNKPAAGEGSDEFRPGKQAMLIPLTGEFITVLRDVADDLETVTSDTSIKTLAEMMDAFEKRGWTRKDDDYGMKAFRTVPNTSPRGNPEQLRIGVQVTKDNDIRFDARLWYKPTKK